MNGKEYGFIPNLDDMSFGEYVDLDTYLSDWQQIEKAMGVLFRPIKDRYKDKYTIEEYQGGGAAEMKDMPMDVVLGSMLFYRLDRIIESMMNYLEKEGLTLQQQDSLLKSGDGINQFYALSQGDINRIEHITKLNVHQCLYMLAFMKDKAEVESKQIKNKIK